MNKLAGLTFLMLMLLGSSIKATSKVMTTYYLCRTFCRSMVEQGRNLFPSTDIYKEMANNYYGSFVVITYMTPDNCSPFKDSPTVSFSACSYQLVDGRLYLNEDRIINYNYKTGSFCK